MFCEDVIINTSDGKRTTLQAAVFVDGTLDEPVSSSEFMDTDIEGVNILFRKVDWPFVRDKIKRGDTIERKDFNGVRYKVYDVKNDNCLGWCVRARSV